MNINKIYSCLTTTLTLSMQHTLHNITYGYATLSDKLFRYVFNNDIDFKGCLLEDQDIDELPFLNQQMLGRHNTITSLIKDYCSSSPLEIINLVQNKVFETTFLMQGIILNGSKIIVNNGIARIFGDNYKVEDNVFSLKNITSFFGFDGSNCSHENVIQYLSEYTWELISDIEIKSGMAQRDTFHNDHFTDKYAHYYIVNNNKGKHYMDVNMLIGFAVGLSMAVVPYVAYKYINAYNQSNNNYNLPIDDNFEDNKEIVGLTYDTEQA